MRRCDPGRRSHRCRPDRPAVRQPASWPEHALRHVLPEAGTLLLFPSYLFHRTLPYAGSGERISISFDLAAA